MTRYNSYTLEQLDAALKKHPSLRRLTSSERTNIYNLAQELIWNNRVKLSVSHGMTIINNILMNDSERETIFTITPTNLPELRTSLFNLAHFLKIAARNKYLKLLNEEQKTFVFNLAQQSVSTYRNNFTDDTLVTTVSMDRYEPRLEGHSIYFDCYATLRAYTLAVKEANKQFYLDAYATLIVKGIKNQDTSFYFDCYATMIVQGLKETIGKAYLDCYTTLNVAGIKQVSVSAFLDCYATLIAQGLQHTEGKTFLDSYAVLSVSGVTTNGVTKETNVSIYLDGYAVIIAHTMHLTNMNIYLDCFATLTVTA